MFSNVSRINIKDVHFSWENALSFNGDSGPYLLYAYARINGIRERAAEAGILSSSECGPECFAEESAFYLAEAIEDFDAEVEKVLLDHEPAHLCNYALNLAKLISKAYLDLKVLGVERELAAPRLALFELASKRLRESLALIGIPVIERM